MTVRACLLAASLVASGCAYDFDGSASNSTEVITDFCEVTGAGVLENGDDVSGDIGDDGTGLTGSWLHETDTRTIELSPSRIECRINGRNLADVWGDATIDGDSAYRYHLFVEDRGVAGPPELIEGTPEIRNLTATRRYRPSDWTDARIDERAIITVPSELPVTVGNAGNQWAWLTFERAETGDEVTCRYRGGASTPLPRTPAELAAGQSYHLERCTGEAAGTAPVDAGSRVDVHWVELHVHTGAHMCPSRHGAETTVSLDLELTPLIERPRALDYYALEVRDAAGDTFFIEGDVVSGDLTVNMLE